MTACMYPVTWRLATHSEFSRPWIDVRQDVVRASLLGLDEIVGRFVRLRMSNVGNLIKLAYS